MSGRHRDTFLRPLSSRLSSSAIRRSAEAILRSDSSSGLMNGNAVDLAYDDDQLAPVMPAIDVVQQLMDEESRNRRAREKSTRNKKQSEPLKNVAESSEAAASVPSTSAQFSTSNIAKSVDVNNSSPPRKEDEKGHSGEDKGSVVAGRQRPISVEKTVKKSSPDDFDDEFGLVIRNNPLSNFSKPMLVRKQEDYEFIPKSVILDVYSNDPEVKRFLKQLTKLGNEFGYNEQDYKCYSCRRPVGMVFGESRLCHFDGHHYCNECHLSEKSVIPARILCNWDFKTHPISKRNQHFLTLISNEPMFELKAIAPLLYKTCPELREIEELRCQAFFIRSYCFTCVQESVSFELTKLIWPREHLIKQTDLYSLEDLVQIKSGALKQVLKNVITFGRQHVLSCMLCCQKGFICELCKSSQIIYPFDTEHVYRCNECQSIYHKVCYKSRSACEECPRCQRLKARKNDS